MIPRATIEEYYQLHLPRMVEAWKTFLRFPSISALPDHDTDSQACARWLMQYLAAMGLDPLVIGQGTKPVVFASGPQDPSRKTVLFYGHYDVQPVDPLDQWSTNPFEPVLKDGRLYARGAHDDKGQVMSSLAAIEFLLKSDALNVNIKILIEGEEESSSRALKEAIPDYRELLTADVMMVADTSAPDIHTPAIVVGLRGVLSLTAVLSGPAHDLHSGVFGGVVLNPATEMARLVASLHTTDGRVAVPGFYDHVAPPTDAERQMAGAATMSDAECLRMTGVPANGGERGVPPAERVAFRPTLEINGLHSGFGGKGSKTIIPAEALLKLSARLVPGQDPATCMQQICTYLAAQTPAGLTLEITESSAIGGALRCDINSPLIQTAHGVLDTLAGHPAVCIWEGASVPVLASLASACGAEPLLVGFGLNDDGVHAPNESYSLEQFRLGFLYTALMLQELAR
jgi:acetylornithine deacetylase/succinyl-diaminopimelate desuccinylase-like protein